ncbi:MAG: hypothetical protein WBF90_33710 [Rivularia sp. (in: cyanobacteria)]
MKDSTYIQQYNLKEEHFCGLTNEQLGKLVRDVYVDWVKQHQTHPEKRHLETWEEIKTTQPDCVDCDIKIGRAIADAVIEELNNENKLDYWK